MEMVEQKLSRVKMILENGHMQKEAETIHLLLAECIRSHRTNSIHYTVPYLMTQGHLTSIRNIANRNRAKLLSAIEDMGTLEAPGAVKGCIHILNRIEETGLYRKPVEKKCEKFIPIRGSHTRKIK